MPGDPEQVRALVVGEPQCARQRREHGRGRALRATLLEAGEVVHRYARELGDLLAAQAGGAPTAPCRQPDVRRAEPVTPGAQALTEIVHTSMMANATPAKVALPVPGSADLW